MKNKVLWLTGLSGTGKTTLAKLLKKKLNKLKFKVKIVDGDDFRKKSKNNNSFTRKNIYLNNLSVINFVNKKRKNFDYIIVAVISPLLKSRLRAKKTFGTSYHEILVRCSLKGLIKRDTKNLYKMAKEKKIKNLIGYNSSINYEKSKYKKIIIDTEKYNKSNSIKKILMQI